MLPRNVAAPGPGLSGLCLNTTPIIDKIVSKYSIKTNSSVIRVLVDKNVVKEHWWTTVFLEYYHGSSVDRIPFSAVRLGILISNII